MLEQKSQHIRTVVLGLVCAAVVGCSLGMAAESVTRAATGRSAADNHYNHCWSGISAWAMSAAANQQCGAAATGETRRFPMIPGRRSGRGTTPARYGLHDMTYYKGRLYLYFWSCSALLLFWPWATLTGHYLFHHHAVAIFCVVGFLTGAALLRSLWRHYFPEVGWQW